MRNGSCLRGSDQLAVTWKQTKKMPFLREPHTTSVHPRKRVAWNRNLSLSWDFPSLFVGRRQLLGYIRLLAQWVTTSVSPVTTPFGTRKIVITTWMSMVTGLSARPVPVSLGAGVLATSTWTAPNIGPRDSNVRLSKSFLSQNAANQHMDSTGHWKPRIECDTCSQKFYTQQDVDQHMKAKGHYRNYCKDCDRHFMNENNLLCVELLEACGGR